MRFAAALLLICFAPRMACGDDLATQIRDLDAGVLPADSKPRQMLADDLRARRDAANQRDREAWQQLQSRADWERFRDLRLKALRESLGPFPPPRSDLKLRVTRTLDGDGFNIENLLFESRPGLLVTANLYVPHPPTPSMPGILICHSHHNSKTQGELQDMGMTWARLGCLVLVMDKLGHGERRQHPFKDEQSYPRPFRVGRQDYWFRYNIGLQLHLVGESLMGWMVWDLMRGVDVLLERPGVDRSRIVLLGAVAGGGDPAAVAAALDPRITVVAPFNFGGPQPETPYPLPADAETSFNYAGGGSWESTRNLRLSARDGFLPWLIVGSLAPRRLIYSHEFAWDRERDPVWKRLNTIWDFYGARENLTFTTGRGLLSGRPPESTHCNNIGPEHRKGVHAALNRWLGIPVPTQEYQKRRPAADLLCLTGDLRPRPLHELLAELGSERATQARQRIAAVAPADRRALLRKTWADALGQERLLTATTTSPRVLAQSTTMLGEVTIERTALVTERKITVPLILFLPKRDGKQRLPVVVGLSQGGKQRFARERSAVIAALLKEGIAVCLSDVRGTGETAPTDGPRGRTSADTALSSTAHMLGSTLLGERLWDLRCVLGHLGQHQALDPKHVLLWGESFASVNASDQNLAVPLDADPSPALAEPLGGLLALFGALYSDNVQAVHVRGGLVALKTLLDSPFIYVPHDAVIPCALTVGELWDVAAALPARSLRIEASVDGLNRLDTATDWREPLRQALAVTGESIQEVGIRGQMSNDSRLVRSLLEQIRTRQ